MKNLFKENNIDVLYVNHKANRFYFSGFNGSAGVAIVTSRGKVTLFVDNRYILNAKKVVKEGVTVKLLTKDSVKEFLKKKNIKRVGIDGSRVTLNEQKAIKKQGVTPVNCDFSWVRLFKTEQEIKMIKKAVSIGDKVFTHILEFIKIGMTEKEVALEMYNHGIKLGATSWSFAPIVASGPNSAIPHHATGTRKIKNNEFLKLDFGFIYKGYCSDMTRTIQIGKADKKLVDAYDVVLKAQLAVIKKGKPGMTCTEVEAIARGVLTEAGLNKYMTHGLGHGLGIEVHESPFFGRDKSFKFSEGVMFTNEPGVYFEGIGGIRIEDDLLVTKTGFKKLNKSPKELITIKG